MDEPLPRNSLSSNLRQRAGGSTMTRPNSAAPRMNDRKTKPWLLQNPSPIFIILAVFLITVMLMVGNQYWLWQKNQSFTLRHLRHSKETIGAVPTHISFQDFPFLNGIVSEQRSHAPLLALYFAASWCPMSTKPTQLLDELFREHLLSNTSLVLVYISSDMTQDSFQAYLRPGWQAIPFHNSLERSGIQRYFRTCAKRELKELGILPEERLHEIPHLYIVSTQTGTVLSSDGLADVREYGTKVLPYWQGLLLLKDRSRSFDASAAETE